MASVRQILKKMRKDDEAKLGKGGKGGEKKEEKKPEMAFSGSAGKHRVAPYRSNFLKSDSPLLFQLFVVK